MTRLLAFSLCAVVLSFTPGCASSGEGEENLGGDSGSGATDGTGATPGTGGTGGAGGTGATGGTGGAGGRGGTGGTGGMIGSGGTGGSGGTTCTLPPTDMIAWWSFDEDGSDRQGGYDATLVGDAAIGEGFVGNALRVDGLDDFAFAEDPDDDLVLQEMTIDAWVNPASLTAMDDARPDSRWQTIVAKYDSSGLVAGTTSWLLVTAQDLEEPGDFTHLRFSVAEEFFVYYAVVTDEPVLSVGEWSHVAATFEIDEDGTNIAKVYVNGEEVSTSITDDSQTIDFIDGDGDPVFIGCLAVNSDPTGPPGTRTPTNFWEGSIDEVEIFDRVLTADEIRNIFDAGRAGKCKL